MITQLTPEQEKQIDVYFQAYLKKGLDTSPTNKKRTIELINECYRQSGFKAPKIKFFKSPFGCKARIKKDTDETKIFTLFLGTIDNYWICFYKYLIEVLNLEIDKDLREKFETFAELSSEVSFWYPFQTVCYVSEKPTEIHLDAQNRLHNLKDLALKYGDNFGIYSINGIRVPEEVVKHPEKITPESIDKESNIEVRRIMINIYGQDKYLINSKYEVLDEDQDQFGQKRRLLRKTNGEDEAIVRVEVINSSPELDDSYKTYYLPVHPELKPLFSPLKNKEGKITLDAIEAARIKTQNHPGQKMTCHNAVASTFGKTGEEYGLSGQFRQGDVFIEFKDGTNKKGFQES